MRRGWRLVGVVAAALAVLSCARLRADEPRTDIAAEERAQLKDDVERDYFEKAEETLEGLRKHSLEVDWGKPLLGQEAPMDALKKEFNAALDAKKYGVAQYYLEQVRTKAESPNIFGPAVDLTLWTIVVFLLLLAVLYRFAWKPMLQGLQKRETDIHSAVEDARMAREEAQKLRQEVQAERAKIEQTRRETIQRAEADAQRRADEIVAAAEAKMKSEHERALRELESAKDQAMQELWRQTANLASVVSTKAIRRSLTPEDHRRFVDEALAELRTEAGNGQTTSA